MPLSIAARAPWQRQRRARRQDPSRRDDVVRAELFGRNQIRDGVGGGDLHGVIDIGGAHVNGAAENAGEGQHVVDLILDVGTARGTTFAPACVARSMGQISGMGLACAKMMGVFRHTADHVLIQRESGTETPMNTSAPFDGVGKRALHLVGIGRLGDGVLILVHALGAAFPNGALGSHMMTFLSPTAMSS